MYGTHLNVLRFSKSCILSICRDADHTFFSVGLTISLEAGYRSVSDWVLSALNKKNPMKDGVNNLYIFIVSNNKFEDRAVAGLVHLEAQPSEIPRLFLSFCFDILRIFAFVLGLTSFLDCSKAVAVPGIISSPAKLRVEKWSSVFLHI